MDYQGQAPKYLKIFGDLERSALGQMNAEVAFPYVHTMKFRLLEKALHEGYSIHELFLALKEIGELHFDDRKSANHRRCLCFLIAHAAITQQQLDAAVNDWLAYPSDLLDKTYPLFNELFTVDMVKRGLSLVRDAKGALRPLANIEAISNGTQLTEAFFLSALYSDDLDALEHLQQSPTLRREFTTNDCSKAVDDLIHWERDAPPGWASYYEGYKPLPNVQATYYRHRPLREYWLQITAAISEGSMATLERVFDPKFSAKLGSEAVLALASDNTLTSDVLEVPKAFLVKHIEAGADVKLAFLTLAYGRIEALDFVDEPISLDDVVQKTLSREENLSWVFPLFLFMFSREEVHAHERGQECLMLRHQITKDPSYLPLIDSLQYRGKAFAADLGL
ncbi:hypothetical protein [Pseudomonas serbica]|uniref:hypothetical protein n=1 Tax=Pseudomonas serbica TaxID=2965074 RepID=UPI00237BBA13|nr:hypothetical protein [Pseudomonas serbica]